jgi:hypothetical protein
MLIDPAKTRRAVHRMKERVAADAASTAGRLATRFQYVTRIEDLCGARNTGLGVRPPGAIHRHQRFCFSAGCLGGKDSADLALSGVGRIAVVGLY